MGNIGGEIASGAASAILHMLAAVPLTMWMILLFAVIAIVFVLRYATNWKVDAVFVGAVFCVCEILAIRQHWIRLGEDTMIAKVQAAEKRVDDYKATNQLVIGCYAKDTVRLDWIWDRTQGKCVRVDGSQ